MVARVHPPRKPADLTDQAQEAVTALRGGLENLREQAGTQAGEVTRRLRERGSEMLSEQKMRAAEELSHLGAAVRRAADKLHDQNSAGLAQYVDTAAAKIDTAAQFLEQRDVADLAGEVGQIARRNPALVMGGLLVAGVALGRFIKAGQQQSTRRSTPRRGSTRSSRGKRTQ